MNRYLVQWKFHTAHVWAEELHIFADSISAAEEQYIEIRWNNGVPENVTLLVTLSEET